MPRHKPHGWPRYMVTRHLRKGGTAYWTPLTWAAQKGFPLSSEAFGNDYAEAKRRCDDVLNRQFDDWRRRDQPPSPSAWLAVGTFDWMVSVYRSSPKFLNKGEKTRRDYDASLDLISRHVLKDGRTFGSLMLQSITPGAADRLFEKLKKKPGGGERIRTAILAMRVAQRPGTSRNERDKPKVVPFENPFAKMGLSYKPKATRPVAYAEMMRFVEAADIAGEASLGTAAMIAFFWLQRPTDIIKRLTWSHYRPADAPKKVRIFHHKTGEVVELPLYDDHDGSALWPEIMTRLENAARHGTLIVTRDKLDRLRKVHLPWSRYYFSHRVAAIRTAAGIDADVKFMGLRRGGNVEGADAGLSDAQLRALSGHRTTAALLRYAPSDGDAARCGSADSERRENEKGEFVEMSH